MGPSMCTFGMYCAYKGKHRSIYINTIWRTTKAPHSGLSRDQTHTSQFCGILRQHLLITIRPWPLLTCPLLSSAVWHSLLQWTLRQAENLAYDHSRSDFCDCRIIPSLQRSLSQAVQICSDCHTVLTQVYQKTVVPSLKHIQGTLCRGQALW